MLLTRIDEWKNADLLKRIKKELRDLGSSENEVEFPYAVVLLASAFVGANSRRLMQVTGYSPEFVNDIANRMRTAGLWVGETIDDAEWDDDPGFVMHVLVAQGDIEVEPGSRPRMYRATKSMQSRLRGHAAKRQIPF